MHVNNQWDLEYKDLEEAFRRYRIDSQWAQGEIEQDEKTDDGGNQVVISRKDKDVTKLRGKPSFYHRYTRDHQLRHHLV